MQCAIGLNGAALGPGKRSCPYFENMLLVDSNELYNELQLYIRDCEHLHYISFDKLHEYDPRHLLSWSI